MINLDADIKVDIENFKWEGALKALLWVNTNELEKVLISQAAWTAWFCVVLGKASSMLEDKDYQLDKKYSELYLKYASEKGGEARITEASIKAKILVDAEYATLHKEYIDLKEKVSKLAGIVKGFEHRKDMIVQLASLKRKELITGDFEDASSPVDLTKVKENLKQS